MTLYTKLYKALDARGHTPYTNHDWTPYLPVAGARGASVPGPWLPPVTGELVAGRISGNGYHIAPIGGFVGWVRAHNFEVEAASDGDLVADGEREMCCRSLRLVRYLYLPQVKAMRYCLYCLEIARRAAPGGYLRVYELENALRVKAPDYQEIARHAARTALGAIEASEAVWVARGYASRLEERTAKARREMGIVLEGCLEPGRLPLPLQEPVRLEPEFVTGGL